MSVSRINFTLNQKEISIETEASRPLVEVLRQDLRLSGTKQGCAIGECGACTILLNGDPVNACLILIGQVHDSQIITIEGIAKAGELHLLQKNFLDQGAIQCGFCTPGMVLSAYALLHKNNNPTLPEIKAAIAGNLCRCTGYMQIIEAIRITAEDLRDKK